MRHQGTLGLHNFGKALKSIHKHESKEQEKKLHADQMKKLGLTTNAEHDRRKSVTFETLGSSHASPTRKADSATVSKYFQSTKDVIKFQTDNFKMIHQMAEAIEKNIEDEDAMQYKIKYGKPLVAEKKVKKEK